MSDRQLTMMAVHAHPDDEATGTGGVLARYAAEGITTIVVTCTDGSCGDGPGGVKPGEPGHDPAAVAATRAAELAISCKVLGVAHSEQLGYHDSGMVGWPTNDAPGSFWSTPVPEAAERLAALIRRYQPDVLLTYDENGGYGHPDHIQVHRVSMAAVDLVESVSKVYMSTVPRSWMENMGSWAKEAGLDWDEPEDAPPADTPPMGVPDEQITAWVDTTGFSDQKYDALAAHSSQSDGEFFLKMGKEKFAKLMRMETFVRVRDTTGSPLREDDLFTGLR
ncbi:PIG-L family deacetylase [Cryptosporangium arvum]|uniref:PIG-L family deacetylase n=1 Tax=Cryptosporangium arvum TaxID=80871 RepID=UPI00055E707F|nr:PIG-L family deacetylase [Cryptosporangium arvum]